MLNQPSNPETTKPSGRVRAIHIDTSLQIEQQKSQSKVEPVRVALSQYVFTSTSSYARKEFKRAWLQDLNLIYKTAENCRQLGEVYVALGKKLWHPRVKRRLSRCLDAINAFLEPHPEMPVGIAVTRLRAHLGNMILHSYKKWERSVTHEYDGTRCIRAAERPRRSGDAFDVTVRECRPSKIQCSVHQFFEDHRDKFAKIENAIKSQGDSVSSELSKTAVAIRAAAKDPKTLCHSDQCSAMSDSLIAVDGIATDHFGANNDKEWKVIAAALDKPLINPVAPTTEPQKSGEPSAT